MVLIPVAFDERLRYQVLHNHLDFVLAAALLGRPDVTTTRILMPVHPADSQHPHPVPRQHGASRTTQ